MRPLVYSKQFKKDFKRESKGRHKAKLSSALTKLLTLLQTDEQLPEKYCDHALSGDLEGFRDAHLMPDLILIYRKTDEALELVRLGSHSELF